MLFWQFPTFNVTNISFLLDAFTHIPVELDSVKVNTVLWQTHDTMYTGVSLKYKFLYYHIAKMFAEENFVKLSYIFQYGKGRCILYPLINTRVNFCQQERVRRWWKFFSRLNFPAIQYFNVYISLKSNSVSTTEPSVATNYRNFFRHLNYICYMYCIVWQFGQGTNLAPFGK